MANSEFGVLYRRIQFVHTYLELHTIQKHALYAVSSFRLPEAFKYGFFPVQSPGTQRVFYPLSWNMYEAAKLYGQEPQYMWIWGFEILKLLQLNEILCPEQALVKAEMFIPCDESNKNGSMFKAMRQIYQKRLEESDPSKAITYKKIMNMAYGKYGQRDHDIKHYISRRRFEHITQNNQAYIEVLGREINEKWYPDRDLRVVGAYPVRGSNDELICLKFEDSSEDINRIPKISRMIHIASQVTAFARAHVWDIVYKCVAQFPLSSNKLLYMDTDSFVWYAMTETVPQLLSLHNMGTGLGQTKRVEHSIQWFHAVAPKMYAYQANPDP